MRKHTLKLTAAAALTTLAAFSAHASEATQWDPIAEAATVSSTPVASTAPAATLTPPMASMPISSMNSAPLSRADVVADFKQARQGGRVDRGEAGATPEVLAQRESYNHAETDRLMALVHEQEYAAQQEAIAQAQAQADAQAQAAAQQQQQNALNGTASPDAMGTNASPDAQAAAPADGSQPALPAWPAGQDTTTTPDMAPAPQSTPLDEPQQGQSLPNDGAQPQPESTQPDTSQPDAAQPQTAPVDPAAPGSALPADPAAEPAMQPAPEAQPMSSNTTDLPVAADGVVIESVPLQQ